MVVLLTTTKAPADKLWTFPQSVGQQVSQEETLVGANVVRHDTQADNVAFISATLGSPPDLSLIAALAAGWLGNLPRITARMARKYPANSVATAKGHLDLQRQGQSSTSKRHRDRQTALQHGDELEPHMDDEFLFTSTMHPKDYENHSDATGRLPVTLYHGNNYIMVSVYKNYIHAVAMKSREKEA